jgi:rod shape determining protein RodA
MRSSLPLARQRANPRTPGTIWRNFDLSSFCIILILLFVGEVMIYSSSESSFLSQGGSLWDNNVFRQAAFALIGMALYFMAAAIDYRIYASIYRWIYIFVIGILLATMVIGHSSFGAQSWIGLQNQGLQPSELCKILMILVLARFLGVESDKMETLQPLLLSLLFVIPPVLLIYQQPDFGTALIVGMIWAGMVFLSGVRWRFILIFTGLLFIGLPIAAPIVWPKLPPHMRERVLLFLHPENDPSGASYNINQALISIGSGGWWGKGFLRGTQSQLHFLRVRHTDFIFSVLAEEMGFIGAILLLLLFVFLLLRLLRLAQQAPDAVGQLVVAGVAIMLFAQAAINLGMNANLLPVTGLPLPLVSYGGSSLISTLLALGLVQSVAMRSKGVQELTP